MLALIYVESGYQTQIVDLSQTYQKMFNLMITQFIEPSRGGELYLGFCSLLTDCVAEVYHFIKINSEENFHKYLKVKQGMMRNELLTKFLLQVM